MEDDLSGCSEQELNTALSRKSSVKSSSKSSGKSAGKQYSSFVDEIQHASLRAPQIITENGGKSRRPEEEVAIDMSLDVGAHPRGNLSVHSSLNRRSSAISESSIQRARYAASIASSVNPSPAVRSKSARGCSLCCWPGGNNRTNKTISSSTQESLSTRRGRWHTSKTFLYFYRTLGLSILIVIPGLILHFFLPSLNIAGVEILLWLSALATLTLMYPFLRLVLHLVLYHIVPESAYEKKRWGDYLFFSTELLNHFAFLLWLLWNFAAWTWLWPLVTYQGIMLQYPLSYLNPLIGVLAMWSMVLAGRKVLVLWWTYHFHQNAFLERVRESLFLEYVIETMREAKRRKKFWLRVEEEKRGGAPTALTDDTLLRPQSDELRKRAKYVVVPNFLKEDDHNKLAVLQECVNAHQWKRLLDHFYQVTLLDEQILEELEAEVDGYDEDLLKAVEESKRIISKNKANKLDNSHKLDIGRQLDETKYHHLHHYHFDRRHRRLDRRLSFVNAHGDDRSSRLASKLFKTLKRSDCDFLELNRDIMPLFQNRPMKRNSTAFQEEHLTPSGGDTNWLRPSIPANDTGSRRTSKANSTLTVDLKQDAIAKGVYNFFITRTSENGMICERDMKHMILRAHRERKRLISSLSGKFKGIVDKSLFCRNAFCYGSS